jgi:hypothetical protein
MEIKKVTRKVLTLSDSEKDLLENTAILLSDLYEEDVINQIFNLIASEAVGGCPSDFEDIARVLHELANNGEYVIKELE